MGLVGMVGNLFGKDNSPSSLEEKEKLNKDEKNKEENKISSNINDDTINNSKDKIEKKEEIKVRKFIRKKSKKKKIKKNIYIALFVRYMLIKIPTLPIVESVDYVWKNLIIIVDGLANALQKIICMNFIF